MASFKTTKKDNAVFDDWEQMANISEVELNAYLGKVFPERYPSYVEKLIKVVPASLSLAPVTTITRRVRIRGSNNDDTGDNNESTRVSRASGSIGKLTYGTVNLNHARYIGQRRDQQNKSREKANRRKSYD